MRGRVATGSSSGLLSGPGSLCLWPKALGMKRRYILSSNPRPPSLLPLNRVFTGRIQDRAVGTQGRGCGFRGAGGSGRLQDSGGLSACWAPTGIVPYGWFTVLSCTFPCKWGSEKLRATRCCLSHCPRSANSHLADQRASPAGFLANLFRFRWCGHSALAQRPRTEGGQVRVPLCGVPLPSRAPWRLGVLRNPGHG